jgi:hypothetical protein
VTGIYQVTSSLAKKQRAIAHRSTLTPDTLGKIIDAVSRGLFLTTAAKLVNVDETTLHLWLDKGKEYSGLADGAATPSNALIYIKLYREVSQARAQLEQRLVETVASTALDKEDWRAATWFLERSYHQNWARKSVTTIEGSETNPVQVAVSWADGLKSALSAADDEPEVIDAEIEPHGNGDGNLDLDGNPDGNGDGE